MSARAITIERPVAAVTAAIAVALAILIALAMGMAFATASAVLGTKPPIDAGGG